ncbi:MAG: hypothetical protein A2514_12640 [Gammaproteobacteria bacterium RIFOXYD12_FULL_61_37]|nr:MAG: hypothetical protein A2514_12640 [Gammaproteobacteria bacterium RIFOXYD12_FULL_61_37]
MLAHNQGGMLNLSQLGWNLMVDTKTDGRYLDLLVDLLLVRRLAPWNSYCGCKPAGGNEAVRSFQRRSLHA